MEEGCGNEEGIVETTSEKKLEKSDDKMFGVWSGGLEEEKEHMEKNEYKDHDLFQ